MGIGTGSVIQRTITPSRTAASVCWSFGMLIGASRNATMTSGASQKPTVRRPRSNLSSAGDSFCWPRLR